jgi:hypothetical protein
MSANGNEELRTEGALALNLDMASVRRAREEAESELSKIGENITIRTDGSPIAGSIGGADGDVASGLGTLTNLAEDRNALLEDIEDELSRGAGVGGGPGDDNSIIPFFNPKKPALKAKNILATAAPFASKVLPRTVGLGPGPGLPIIPSDVLKDSKIEDTKEEVTGSDIPPTILSPEGQDRRLGPIVDFIESLSGGDRDNGEETVPAEDAPLPGESTANDILSATDRTAGAFERFIDTSPLPDNRDSGGGGGFFTAFDNILEPAINDFSTAVTEFTQSADLLPDQTRIDTSSTSRETDATTSDKITQPPDTPLFSRRTNALRLFKEPNTAASEVIAQNRTDTPPSSRRQNTQRAAKETNASVDVSSEVDVAVRDTRDIERRLRDELDRVKREAVNEAVNAVRDDLASGPGGTGSAVRR